MPFSQVVEMVVIVRMSSFGYRDDLVSNFLELSPADMASVFSISCMEPAHWEASPSWDMTIGELDELIMESAETLLEDWQYRSLERDGQLSGVKDAFYHGDMINRFLCSYLSEELNHRCVPESDGNAEQFDVTIFRDEMQLCEIGVKRMATSSQIIEYLEQHRDKVQSTGQADSSLLCLYYPVTELSESNRVREFIAEYEFMSPYVDSFYESQNHFISAIPAPLNPDDSGINPLEETRDLLLDSYGLSR